MSVRIMGLLDILAAPEQDFPLLVVTDTLAQRRGFWGLFGYIAKAHTKGRYSHAMWYRKPGVFYSQGALYGPRAVTDYVDKHHRVKLWYNPEWTPEKRRLLCDAMDIKAGRPWHKRRYSPLGIVGQIFGLTRFGLGLPGADICSESAVEFLSLVEPAVIDDIGRQPSPVGLNRWCEEHEQMQVYGLYDPELTGRGLV